jgi:hypothetical protein
MSGKSKVRLPKLVGRGELIKLFGVSKTRIVQLSESDGFPEPVDVLMAGKIWALADIEAWPSEPAATSTTPRRVSHLARPELSQPSRART